MTDKKMTPKDWEEMISWGIKRYDLQGRSFTSGVSLYYLIAKHDLNDQQENEVKHLIWNRHEKIVGAMMCEGWYTNIGDLATIMPADQLDEIARELCGEEED